MQTIVHSNKEVIVQFVNDIHAIDWRYLLAQMGSPRETTKRQLSRCEILVSLHNLLFMPGTAKHKICMQSTAI